MDAQPEQGTSVPQGSSQQTHTRTHGHKSNHSVLYVNVHNEALAAKRHFLTTKTAVLQDGLVWTRRHNGRVCAASTAYPSLRVPWPSQGCRASPWAAKYTPLTNTLSLQWKPRARRSNEPPSSLRVGIGRKRNHVAKDRRNDWSNEHVALPHCQLAHGRSCRKSSGTRISQSLSITSPSQTATKCQTYEPCSRASKNPTSDGNCLFVFCLSCYNDRLSRRALATVANDT